MSHFKTKMHQILFPASVRTSGFPRRVRFQCRETVATRTSGQCIGGRTCATVLKTAALNGQLITTSAAAQAAAERRWCSWHAPSSSSSSSPAAAADAQFDDDDWESPPKVVLVTIVKLSAHLKWNWNKTVRYFQPKLPWNVWAVLANHSRYPLFM